MVFILISFVIVAFWLEKCIGVGAFAKGFSLKNLSLYSLILFWGLTLKTRNTFFQQNNLNRYMLILMIMIALSIFTNVYVTGIQTTSLKKEIVSYKGLLNPWLLFFLITTLIRDKRTCERSILALSLFLLATVFAVLIQNYLGVDWGTQIDNPASFGRSAGFSEANQYAAFLVLFLPLFLSYIFFQEEMSKRIKGFFLFLIGLIGLISTISKGGFIAFFVSIGYLFFYAYRKKMIDMKKVFLLMFFLFTVVTASYLFFPSHIEERIKERITLQSSEPYNPWAREFSFAYRLTSGRTEIWMYSLGLIAQRPILGYGSSACENQLGISTHSDPLKWLLNHGIIGFLLFSMIYIQIFRHVKYHLKTSTNPKSRMLYLGYICGFIGYVVAMFGVNMHEPRIIFWIYTAIIYKHTQLDAIWEEQDNIAPSFQPK
jgi:O-antigen ligase